MPWTETAPGRFERPYDDSADFLVTFCTRAHHPENWIIHTIAELHLPETHDTGHGAPASANLERLTRAWLNVRYRFPFIATTLAAAAYVYQRADAALIQQWTRESVFEEPGDLDAWLAQSRTNAWTALYYFPQTNQLVLRCHHYHIDGIGSMHLLHNLLQFLAADTPAPTFGDETKHLPPGFTETRGAVEVTESIRKEAGTMLGEYLGSMPSIGVPLLATPKPPGGAKRLKRVYTPRATAGLVAACKKRGVTVTAAVHAAITVATQEMQPVSTPTDTYTSMAIINYRPYLPEPYNNGREWPTGVVVWGVPFTMPRRDFAGHAEAYQRLYHQPWRRGECRLFDTYDTFIGSVAQVLKQPPPPDLPPASQPMLSSLGIVDSLLQSEYPGAVPVQVRGPELVLHLTNTEVILYQWTWQGRFHLSINYNATAFDDRVIHRYVARIAAVLFGEMGVEEERKTGQESSVV